MDTRSSIKRKLSMSPTPSQEAIDPQLRQSAATNPTQSRIRAGHTAPAADGHSTGMVSSDNQRGGNPDGEEVTANVHDAEASDMDSEQLTTPDADPAPAPAPAPAQAIAGVGRLTITHHNYGNLQAGYASYYQSRRQLVVVNDDVLVLHNNTTLYVDHLYGCITSKPGSMTRDQSNMADLFAKKLDAIGHGADQMLADISSMTVANINKLHHRGDHLFIAQFKSLKPCKEDSTMTATQRFDVICDLLHAHKKHVIDIMEGGADAITRFVAAPKGAARRKASYKDNNVHRSDHLKRLKQLEASGNQGQGDAKSGADEDDEDA